MRRRRRQRFERRRQRGDNVDFPASDPYVLACGGTSVQASNNAITSETVWNDGAQGGSAAAASVRVFRATAMPGRA